MKRGTTFKKSFTVLMITFFLLTGTTFGFAQSTSQGKASLPDIMTWTAYGMGSAGYVMAASVGNALFKKYNSRLRIIPSGTDFGRLSPLKDGKVEYSLNGLSTWLAWRGVHDFATLELGPQPLRVVWQTAGDAGVASAKDANIINPAVDLKGKRWGYMTNDPSFNFYLNKADLAFFGLTDKDVVKVIYPNAMAHWKGIVEGKSDVAFFSLGASTAYELASSHRGIRWIEYPAADKEGWARLQKVAPFLGPKLISKGPGIVPGKDKPLEMITYAYPSLVTYDKKDDNSVYNLTKAIHESYDLYKDDNVSMPSWRLEDALKTPQFAPFHRGTIKYFKEIGVWTKELEATNKRLLTEEKERMARWKKFRSEALQKKYSPDEIRKLWDKSEEL